MVPAVMALDPATGDTLWIRRLGSGTHLDQIGHGGVRSCIMDNNQIVCAGYIGEGSAGFKFVADAGTPVVWRLDTSGNLLAERILEVEGKKHILNYSPTDPLLAGMGQVAKIRKDATGGFVLCSTGYGNINGTEEVESVIVVKINSNLELEWSQVRVVVELEV